MIGECTRSSCSSLEVRHERQRPLARRSIACSICSASGERGVVVTARVAMARRGCCALERPCCVTLERKSPERVRRYEHFATTRLRECYAPARYAPVWLPVSFQRARIGRPSLVAEHADAPRSRAPGARRSRVRARSSGRRARAACARARRPRRRRLRRGISASTRSARAPTSAALSPPGQPSRHRLQPGRCASDLGGGQPLVVAVVPLEQVRAHLRLGAEPAQLARFARAQRRADEHQRESATARSRAASAARCRAAAVGERDVGAPGVPAVEAPLGLGVAHEHDLARGAAARRALTSAVPRARRRRRRSPSGARA